MAWYWVRHPATYAGAVCDFGQLVQLDLATARAEQLTRLGYLVATKRPPERAQCGACGEEFLSESDRDAHGRKRHSQRFAHRSALDEDEHDDREEQAVLDRAPLYLDQTDASRR
jgi:hypothetical protein